MFNAALFELGPYNVSLTNILVVGLIAFLGAIFGRVARRALKQYLGAGNFHIQGRRIAGVKLLAQAIYALAAYLALVSLQINNPQVTFSDFLDYNFINSKIKINFGHVLSIIFIWFVAKVAVNLVQLYLHRRFRKDDTYDPGREYVYLQVAKYIIFTVSFIFMLGALDVKPGIFLGGSAALLVGLGLGLQDVFKDMFSGLVLLFEGSIRVGDVIEIGDKSGQPIVAKILKINVRTTQIETRDGNVLIVPNARLTQEYIENWTHGTTLSRFRINLAVAYGSDTEKVQQLLEQAARSHPNVKKNEPILVRMIDFGDNGLKMELVFWADQSWDVSNIKSEIRFEIDRLFRKYGVEIPFPQREVRIVER